MIRPHTWLARLVATGALCTAAVAANAQTTSGDRTAMPYQKDFWGYAGAAVGRSDYNFDCAPTVSPCDDKGLGGKIWAGGRFNRTFGLEGGYTHLGHVDVGPGETSAQGLFVHGLAGVPFGQSSSINAKLGTIYGRTKTSGIGGHDQGFGLSYGVAGIIGLTQALDLRLDWDRHRMEFAGRGDDNVNLYTVGLQWKFR